MNRACAAGQFALPYAVAAEIAFGPAANEENATCATSHALGLRRSFAMVQECALKLAAKKLTILAMA